VGDSSSSLCDTRESKSEQRAAERSERAAETRTVVQPVTVYQQEEVTQRRREHPATSPQRHHDDDDGSRPKPRSETVVVSKTPRENITLSLLEQLPDRADGSRNTRPGSASHASHMSQANGI